MALNFIYLLICTQLLKIVQSTKIFNDALTMIENKTRVREGNVGSQAVDQLKHKSTNLLVIRTASCESKKKKDKKARYTHQLGYRNYVI